jgi:CheY-like chemotaxis protein
MKDILVVEDDESIRECLVEVLRDYGYQVDQAENGLVALRKIEAQPGRFGCLLLDIRMPVMDGPELLRRLADRDLVVPTVIISAAKEILDLGAIPWLKKPFELTHLQQAVQTCLGEGSCAPSL